MPMHVLWPTLSGISTMWPPSEVFHPEWAAIALIFQHQCNNCAEDGNEVYMMFPDEVALKDFQTVTNSLIDTFLAMDEFKRVVEEAKQNGHPYGSDYKPDN